MTSSETPTTPSPGRARRRRGPRRAGLHRGAVALLALAQAFAAVATAQEAAPEPLPWMRGPGTAAMDADLAEIELGEDHVFLDAEGTRRLMELTENPVSGTEVATVAPVSDAEGWFVVFEFDEIGYVPDEDQDALDPDALLTSIREGTEAANEARRKRGWGTMTIVGWHEEPHYDARTNNLSWAVIGEADGHRNVNRIVKLLGRRGVMTATLVASPDELESAVPRVDRLLDGYRFKPGNTYAEYVPGKDKLAQYGLAALVVGGGAAALAKSGLLAKLWKPIAAGLAAIAAGVARLFRGGRTTQHDPEKPIA